MAKSKSKPKNRAKTQEQEQAANAKPTNVVPISPAARLRRVAPVTAGNDLHQSLLLLDRLEELREELTELGLTSLAEIDARIAELEAIVGDEPDDDDWDDNAALSDDDNEDRA